MSIGDTFLFLIVPITFATTLTIWKIDLRSQVNNLIAATAIFGGFLFNLLAIIYGQMEALRNDATREQNELKKRLIKEVHINISFNIVVSLFTVAVLLIYSTDFKSSSDLSTIAYCSLSWLSWFLVALFSLTLLMVLNRVYLLLKKDSEF